MAQVSAGMLTRPSPKRSPACGEERVVSRTLDSHGHARPAKTETVLHCPRADIDQLQRVL